MKPTQFQSGSSKTVHMFVLRTELLQTVQFGDFKQTNSAHASEERKIVWDACLSVPPMTQRMQPNSLYHVTRIVQQNNICTKYTPLPNICTEQ